MKEIKAYIKPHKLDAVTEGLHAIENLTGVSVVEVKGFGRSRKKDGPGPMDDDWVFYAPHIKIEIVCLDEMVDRVVATIQKSAHTGLHGDGKIYISTIDEAIRIETGKPGAESV